MDEKEVIILADWLKEQGVENATQLARRIVNGNYCKHPQGLKGFEEELDLVLNSFDEECHPTSARNAIIKLFREFAQPSADELDELVVCCYQLLHEYTSGRKAGMGAYYKPDGIEISVQEILAKHGKGKEC